MAGGGNGRVGGRGGVNAHASEHEAGRARRPSGITPRGSLSGGAPPVHASHNTRGARPCPENPRNLLRQAVLFTDRRRREDHPAFPSAAAAAAGLSADVVDGDELRARLPPALSHSRADRLHQFARAIFVSELLAAHRVIPRSPRRALRLLPRASSRRVRGGRLDRGPMSAPRCRSAAPPRLNAHLGHSVEVRVVSPRRAQDPDDGRCIDLVPTAAARRQGLALAIVPAPDPDGMVRRCQLAGVIALIPASTHTPAASSRALALLRRTRSTTRFLSSTRVGSSLRRATASSSASEVRLSVGGVATSGR